MTAAKDGFASTNHSAKHDTEFTSNKMSTAKEKSKVHKLSLKGARDLVPGP